MNLTVIHIIQAMAFIAVILAVEGLYLFLRSANRREKAANRRMEIAGARNERVLNPELFRRSIEGGPLSRLSALLVPGMDKLIWKSAVKTTPLQMLTIMSASFVGILFFTSTVLRFQPLFAFALAGAVGIGIPMLFLNTRASGRQKKFNEQLPSSIDIMVRGLQAGHPVPVAIEMVAREVEDPIGSEFGHALDEMNYGQERSAALRGIAERYTSPEFLFLVSSIEMQKETGGNLAEILSNLSKVIRERAMMRKKIAAMSAEGRISCFVVGGLPFALVVVIMLLNPSFFMDVANDVMFWPMIGGGFVLWVLGITWIWRMVNFKF